MGRWRCAAASGGLIGGLRPAPTLSLKTAAPESAAGGGSPVGTLRDCEAIPLAGRFDSRRIIRENRNFVDNRRMQIFIATGIFHPEPGGPATYLYHLLPELQARGHDVTVLTFGDDRPTTTRIRSCASRGGRATRHGSLRTGGRRGGCGLAMTWRLCTVSTSRFRQTSARRWARWSATRPGSGRPTRAGSSRGGH